MGFKSVQLGHTVVMDFGFNYGAGGAEWGSEADVDHHCPTDRISGAPGHFLRSMTLFQEAFIQRLGYTRITLVVVIS